MLRAWLKRRFPALLDIDDVVQESYARVWATGCAKSISSPKAFLFTTARNLALDQIRHGKVIDLESLAEIDDSSVFVDEPDVHEVVCRNQELELLTQAIQSLPERCRQVLTVGTVRQMVDYVENARQDGLRLAGLDLHKLYGGELGDGQAFAVRAEKGGQRLQ